MYTKGSRFYADWRDRRGNRRRRAFATQQEAITWEEEQKRLAHPKKAGPAHKSPRSSGPTSKRGKQSAEVRTGGRKQCSKSAKPLSRKRALKAPRT